jgi:hypothetical protein
MDCDASASAGAPIRVHNLTLSSNSSYRCCLRRHKVSLTVHCTTRHTGGNIRDLSPYERAFDDAYPDYATGPYEAIKALTERFTASQALQLIDCNQFQRFAELLEPLIEIKNYKAQAPFPTNIRTVIRLVIQLKQCAVPSPPLSGNPERIFFAILDQKGFQLPTISAVFHFCHPGSFPIVDRNVEAACEILKDAHASDFRGLRVPKLPASTTSALNKLEKYRAFMAFIDHVVQLQRNQYGGGPDYRFVDKALMVLGAGKK